MNRKYWSVIALLCLLLLLYLVGSFIFALSFMPALFDNFWFKVHFMFVFGTILTLSIGLYYVEQIAGEKGIEES